MNKNKILTTSILLLSILNFLGQEKWTLYPEKPVSSSNDSITKSELPMDNENDSINSDISIKDTNKTNYIRSKGAVNFNKDKRILKLNKYLAENGKYKGFAVQLSVSQENQKIKTLRKIFIENFPDELLFDEYIAPNIFLYAGKYQNKNDAFSLKKKLEPLFNNTMVVSKSFQIGTEKKE